MRFWRPLNTATAVLVGIVGPIVLLRFAAPYFGGHPSAADAGAASDQAKRGADLAQRLHDTPPGILIIGNSKAMTDMDPDIYSKALNYTKPVFRAEVPASDAPQWYAFLRQRVFTAGYVPDVVIVYGTLAGMLRVAEGQWWAREHLENEHLTATERVQRKVLGGQVSARVDRARARGAELREAAINAGRDLVVGALFGEAGEDRMTAGRKAADAALDEEFGASATYFENAQERVGPVVEADPGLPTSAGADPDASLIPDLIALAHTHGSAIIFVRAPLPEGSKQMDAVPVDRERAALLLINRLGAGWLDLHDMPLPADAFGDFIHLAPSGRTAVSTRIARALADAHVLQGGALPPAVARVAPSHVERVGTPVFSLTATAALAPGYVCTWLLPAPELAMLANDALNANGIGAPSPLVASVVDEVPSSAELHPRPTPDLSACGQSIVHTAAGLLLAPVSQLPDPTFAVTLSPALPLVNLRGDPVWWAYPGTALTFSFDAPWDRPKLHAYVRAQVLGAGRATLSVGDQTVPLVQHGRVYEATIDALPPTGKWAVAVHAAADAWVVVDELVLGTDERVELIGAPMQPVDALRSSISEVAGEPLPTTVPFFATREVTLARIGAECPPIWHTGPASAPGPLDRYLCFDKGAWALPGDHLRFPVPDEYTAVLGLGGDTLSVSAMGFGADPKGLVHASFVVRSAEQAGKGAVLARGSADFPNSGPALAVDIPLSTPLPPRAPLEIDVDVPQGGPYLFLERVHLVESEMLAQ